MENRSAGILLPISSLPSDYGIGCFSKSAYEFVDWLKEAGQTYWQILPLGPTSYGDSPYQSFSTFAGNPYFIDLDTLVEEGVLAKKQGKGTFVQEEKMTEDLSSPNSFTNLCKRNGKVPGGKTLKCTLQEAKDRDRQLLKLENGEMVILVERVRTADDVPVMLEKLYFPGHLKNILVEDLNNASLYQILLEKYGLQSGNSVMEISVCEATPEEAAELKVKTGTPCLLMEEIVYDQYDKPFHRTKSVLRGDKFKYISPRMNVVKHVNSN